jgi:hypothetical protein
MSQRKTILGRLSQDFGIASVMRVGLFCTALCLTAAALGAVSQSDQAGSKLAPLASIKASSAKATESPNAPLPLKSKSKPLWSDLTVAQQVSLKPLAANWGSLGEAQKRKWMAIATNYPKLSTDEQIKLHSRMTDWAALSQHQRAQARMNFAETKLATPSQKTATWQAYQALSQDEKKKLVSLGDTKGPGVAAVARPVSPQKLASIPVSRPAPKQGLKMAAASPAVDQNTLLPNQPLLADHPILPKN